MNKAEIARELGISRSYVTMLAKGERQPSKSLQTKIDVFTRKCSLPASFACFPSKVSRVRISSPAPLTPNRIQKILELVGKKVGLKHRGYKCLS